MNGALRLWEFDGLAVAAQSGDFSTALPASVTDPADVEPITTSARADSSKAPIINDGRRTAAQSPSREPISLASFSAMKYAIPSCCSHGSAIVASLNMHITASTSIFIGENRCHHLP